MNRSDLLRKRVRCLIWIVIAGLVFGGATAIPLQTELNSTVQVLGADHNRDGERLREPAGIALWLVKVRDGLNDTFTRYPFIAYGTDWLAFGHFVIALAFVWPLRDPVRYSGLFTFGIIACICVIPFALVMGQVRQIPLGWRLIDCSFGVVGLIPLWFCRRYARELEQLARRDA